MDVKKIKNLLDRASNLVGSAASDGQFSPLERDLFKSYLLDIYKLLDAEQLDQKYNPHNPTIVAPKEQLTTTTVESTKPIIAKPTDPEIRPEIISNNPQHPTEQEIIPDTPSSDQHAKDVTVVSQQETSPVSPVVKSTYQSNGAAKSTAVETPTIIQSAPLTTIKQTVPQEVEDLFEEVVVTDLSQKLSEFPIDDLTKAFSLNERILTINELFGGDHTLFNKSLTTINEMSQFTEAQQYMIRELAIPLDWADSGRKGMAMNFIKLVRRKFK